jgi:hypothetical protein
MELCEMLTQYLSDDGRSVLCKRTRDRLGGGVVSTLRKFLYEYSGGICIVCELQCTLDPGKDNSAEVGHIIPASFYGHSDNRSGYAPGNVATMCKECNRNAKDFPFHEWLSAIRSDLIPTEWPSMYKKAWKAKETHGEMAFAIRKDKGLPF